MDSWHSYVRFCDPKTGLCDFMPRDFCVEFLPESGPFPAEAP